VTTIDAVALARINAIAATPCRHDPAATGRAAANADLSRSRLTLPPAPRGMNFRSIRSMTAAMPRVRRLAASLSAVASRLFTMPRKTRRARWAATEAWRKHVEASRSEFLRTIAQVASKKAHEIDGTSRNGEGRRRLDNLNPLPSEGRGHKFESCRARQISKVRSGHIGYVSFWRHG
jgi:hypothetical protein